MDRENMYNYAMGLQNELNGSSEQLRSCFFNPNWDNSMDQNDPFESALSSLVSSPVTTSGAQENIVLRELIGKLGSICNSGGGGGGGGGGEVSPHSYIKSANTSCYSTPLNSPPKLNLSMVMDHPIRGNGNSPFPQLNSHQGLAPLPTDPGFAERAARFSCFANRSLGGLNGFNGLNGHLGGHNNNNNNNNNNNSDLVEPGKLSRVSSNQSLKAASQVVQDGNAGPDQKLSRLSSSSTTPENAEFGDSRENSSVSEQIPVGDAAGISGQNDVNSRKRKSVSKGKGKDVSKDVADAAAENNESSAKRSKSDDSNGSENDTNPKAGENGNNIASGDGKKKENKDNQKPEPPKDYIHVRARRGQATDAHSLAERVRREKISQRMKLLQDLVPGCNKVTGKAVMLDEIINYVQSLQRQVEFLSMKLATINPRMDVNIEAFLSKDMNQSRGSLPQGTYPSDSAAPPFPFPFQSPSLHNGIPNGTEMPLSMNHVNAALSRNPSMQLTPVDSYSEAASQASTFWENDLQSIVFGQNQAQNNVQGVMTSAQMKVEL